MEKLRDLIVKAQEKDQAATLAIIDKFKPKIQKSLCQVPLQERDDLSQELCLKMIEVIRKFKIS